MDLLLQENHKRSPLGKRPDRTRLRSHVCGEGHTHAWQIVIPPTCLDQRKGRQTCSVTFHWQTVPATPPCHATRAEPTRHNRKNTFLKAERNVCHPVPYNVCRPPNSSATDHTWETHSLVLHVKLGFLGSPCTDRDV